MLLWTQRLSGTGNASLAGVGNGIHMVIIDMGDDPGDTATEL